jgi:hypothetical protein
MASDQAGTCGHGIEQTPSVTRSDSICYGADVDGNCSDGNISLQETRRKIGLSSVET